MNNINTIFYYADSLTFSDYITMLQSGEITYRTIVFATAQKAIYKGGVQYGVTDLEDLKKQLKDLLDGQEIIQKIENIVNNHFDLDPQDLPTASKTKKGCIKVGTGLQMSGDTMSVDFSNMNNGVDGINGLDGLVEQIIKTDASARASKSAYGVVRVGDGIDVTNGIISVSLTKGDKGDKGDTGAKGDKGDTGDRGPAGPSYDDSELRNLINGNISRLQGLIDQFDQKVQDQVEEMLDDVDWMRENWPSGSGSTSNFGQQDVESYLQTIGVWEENEAHTKLNAKWSKITQDVSNITARVSALELNSGSGGTSSGSALTAEQILQIEKIDDLETAVAGLSTSYASFELDENKQLEIIRWLSSALNLYTNANATWTDLASAAHDTSVGLSAISDLNTRVTTLRSDLDTLQTEGLEASANLSTLVQSAIDDAIATSGFVSTSALNTALAEYTTTAGMYAYVGDQVGPVNTKATNALAGLEACAKKVNGKLESSVNVWGDQISLSSGHKLTISSADEIAIAAATLNAILDSATIKANKVNWNVSGYTIDADKIVLSANHKLAISSANQLDISAATLNAILGDATISADNIDFTANNFSIDASKINFTGNVLINRVIDGLTANGVEITDNAILLGDGSFTYRKNTNRVVISGGFDCQGDILLNSALKIYNPYNELKATLALDSNEDLIISTNDNKDVAIQAFLYGNDAEFDNISLREDLDVLGNISVTGVISGQHSGNVSTRSIRVKDFNGGSEYGTITYETSPDHAITFDSLLDAPEASFDQDLSVGGTIYCHNGVNTSSDERIKENIVELNPNIEDIANTRIVTFNFKDNEEKKLGTIAQDWQTIFPEAVKDKDDILTLDYDAISIASAVTAAREIVELKKKNAELEARLAALEAKLG